MTESFSGQVNAWTRKSKKRMTAVFRESAQNVIADSQKPRGAGGRMPIDSGFLRASGQASLSGFQGGAGQGASGGSYNYSDSASVLTIASAEIGDTVFFSWSASYGPAVEFGARGRAPAAFMRGAAAKWPQIVAAAVRKAQSIS